MPSWNVHTAHVERLLAEDGAEALGISDVNSFLFGNYVPDIYVGWMVKVDERIDYMTTHWSKANYIPTPQVDRFWLTHVRGGCDDLTIGTLCHLICDRVYNAMTRSWAQAHDIKLSDEIRIKKQADFSHFGHSLNISMLVEPTDELLRQAAAFPQYRIEEKDARAAIEVARDIVTTNSDAEDPADAHYKMLDQAFFDETFEVAHRCMRSTLLAFARGI
ncbi:MAG: hypothetical protein IJ125_04265 [Atopobiaceae bacterium]|nr:hypothetical protein [Atopobiaceae bacterium]